MWYQSNITEKVVVHEIFLILRHGKISKLPAILPD